MKAIPRILVIDDEQDIREILEFNLSSEGFLIDTIESAEKALELKLEQYDLLLVDIMMGGMNGYKFASHIRSKLKLDVPIIFLTAKSEENDLLTGFNVGGDDYISKPFSIKELVVRIKAVLKRGGSKKKEKSIKFKGLKIDMDRHIVTIDDKRIDLTKKEFEILDLLLEHKGKYITREEILNIVWSNDVVVTERNVDVNITRLRKKIGKYGNLIKGKSGFGYCFDDE